MDPTVIGSLRVAERLAGSWSSRTLKQGSQGTRYTLPKLARHAGTTSDRIDLAYLKDAGQTMRALEYEADVFGASSGAETIFSGSLGVD